MAVTVEEAIEHLYRVAVIEQKTTSPVRLSGLAGFCVQELERRGVADVGAEVAVQGFGRVKQWDVAWEHAGKARHCGRIHRTLASSSTVSWST